MERQTEPWLVTVVRWLQANKGKWRAISRETNIPYDTLTKIALGRVMDPRVSNVQALYDYFESLPDEPEPAEQAGMAH